jgi:hypothetical protein
MNPPSIVSMLPAGKKSILSATTASLGLSLALVCASALWTPSVASAQAPAAAAADAEPSRAEVEQYVKELRELIDKKEQNATTLINQIRGHDKAIQDGVSKILSLLSDAEDSTRTRTKVAKLKADTVAGLVRAAKTYAQKRNEIAAQLGDTTNPYTRDDLFKVRGALDDRIGKMVDAAVGLALTMETDEGNEKYIKGPNVVTGRHGIGVQETYRNPEYDQKKREGALQTKISEGLTAGLEASIKRLQTEEAQAAEALKAPGLTDERKAEITAEKERTAQLITERTAQLQQIKAGAADGGSSSAGAAAGSGDAKVVENAKQFASIEEIVQVTAAGARQQFARLLTAYQDLSGERLSLADLKLKLDKSEEWLKTHPAAK